MAQMVLVPAGGIGRYSYRSAKIIRLVSYGCTNRPFFHVVVTEKRKYQFQPCIEQVGSFDPMPNENDEKLVSFNFDRIKHWLGRGALITDPVARLLGLSGFMPIHPQTYMRAWRNRRKVDAEEAAKSDTKAEE